mmetsp:Transcript_34/g.75  ORF Transcript_34/g.75 Transcript_34/m.75 type:complete len:726 (-) Transcript_34:75-2252(-)
MGLGLFPLLLRLLALYTLSPPSNDLGAPHQQDISSTGYVVYGSQPILVNSVVMTKAPENRLPQAGGESMDGYFALKSIVLELHKTPERPLSPATISRLKPVLAMLGHQNHARLQMCLPYIYHLMELSSDQEVEHSLPQLAALILANEEHHSSSTQVERAKQMIKEFTWSRLCGNMFMGIKLCWLFRAAMSDAEVTDDEWFRLFQSTGNPGIKSRPDLLLKEVEEVMRTSSNWPMVMRNLWSSYYDYCNSFLDSLMNLSNQLANYEKEERQAIFKATLQEMNQVLKNSALDEKNWLHLPAQLLSGNKAKVGKVWRILSIVPSECKILPSRERCPFIVHCEVLQTWLQANSSLVYIQGAPVGYGLLDVMEEREIPQSMRDVSMTADQYSFLDNHDGLGFIQDDDDDFVKDSSDHLMQPPQPHWHTDDPTQGLTQTGWTRYHAMKNVFGELDSEKQQRIRVTSPYGHLKQWRLVSFIVKAGDDLRLEQLAMQVLSICDDVFQKENIGIWLMPYMIICSGSQAGLIECVSDARSVDDLKKKFTTSLSLKDYFESMYGQHYTPLYKKAAENFARSLAGYSLLTYLLQIKDRHNANIMIDKDGHIIHIDFGFILGIVPGVTNIKFETAPFKMTKDYVDILGGPNSPEFELFENTFVQGYFAIQRNLDEICNVIEMMSSLKQINRQSAIKDLVTRMSLKDEQSVRELIRLSTNSWTTYMYDRYQKTTNDIYF